MARERKKRCAKQAGQDAQQKQEGIRESVEKKVRSAIAQIEAQNVTQVLQGSSRIDTHSIVRDKIDQLAEAELQELSTDEGFRRKINQETRPTTQLHDLEAQRAKDRVNGILKEQGLSPDATMTTIPNNDGTETIINPNPQPDDRYGYITAESSEVRLTLTKRGTTVCETRDGRITPIQVAYTTDDKGRIHAQYTPLTGGGIRHLAEQEKEDVAKLGAQIQHTLRLAKTSTLIEKRDSDAVPSYNPNPTRTSHNLSHTYNMLNEPGALIDGHRANTDHAYAHEAFTQHTRALCDTLDSLPASAREKHNTDVFPDGGEAKALIWQRVRGHRVLNGVIGVNTVSVVNRQGQIARLKSDSENGVRVFISGGVFDGEDRQVPVRFESHDDVNYATVSTKDVTPEAHDLIDRALRISGFAAGCRSVDD